MLLQMAWCHSFMCKGMSEPFFLLTNQNPLLQSSWDNYRSLHRLDLKRIIMFARTMYLRPGGEKKWPCHPGDPSPFCGKHLYSLYKCNHAPVVCSRNVAVLCHVLSFPSQLPSINKSDGNILNTSQNCLVYTGPHCQSPNLYLNHISPELLPCICNRPSHTLSDGTRHTAFPLGVVWIPHRGVNTPTGREPPTVVWNTPRLTMWMWNWGEAQTCTIWEPLGARDRLRALQFGPLVLGEPTLVSLPCDPPAPHFLDRVRLLQSLDDAPALPSFPTRALSSQGPVPPPTSPVVSGSRSQIKL